SSTPTPSTMAASSHSEDLMRDRELVLRVRLPQFLGRRWFLATVVILLCSGAVVYATVPNTFKSGDPLSSAAVNTNFSSLDTRLTAVEGKVGFGWTFGYCSGTAVTSCPITCTSGHVYGGGCYGDHNAVSAQYPNLGAINTQQWICKFSPADTGTVFALCGP
ncbi:MAG TPA: hypothetical protein VIA18_20790, partial [Polyangia bacterium]|nr:hypothetical protein [Polyangia bacterium]